MKEDNTIFLTKWGKFLTSFDAAQTKKLQYAKFLECISMYNRPEYVKLLISLALKVFNSFPELKFGVRTKKSEKISLMEVEEEVIYDANVIMVDAAIVVLGGVVDKIKEKLPEDNKISSIDIDIKGNILTFYLVI